MINALPPQPVRWKQILNAATGLLLLWWLYRYFRRYVEWFPITIESLLQIVLSEFNRQKNLRRVASLDHDSASDEEKGFGARKRATRCLASVVGYREEPTVFRKCLQSYYRSPGLEVIVIGIDGDQSEDLLMVEIAEEVRSPPSFDASFT